jgi:hypothetical protein
MDAFFAYFLFVSRFRKHSDLAGGAFFIIEINMTPSRHCFWRGPCCDRHVFGHNGDCGEHPKNDGGVDR